MLAHDSSAMGRRSFLKTAAVAGAALLPAGALLADRRDDLRGGISDGDAAILRFLAAAETLETDAWHQAIEGSGFGGVGPGLMPQEESDTVEYLKPLFANGPQ